MSETSEIKSFMRTVLSAIDYGLSLKDIQKTILNSIEEDFDLNKIIDCVSVIYGVKKNRIFNKHLRQDEHDVKQICYCIMKNKYDMSLREIAKTFKTNHNSVRIGVNRLKNISTNIPSDKKFLDTYDKAIKKLKIKI